MTSKSNRSPANRPASPRRQELSSQTADGGRLAEPRPFRRRPWLLAATALALAVWLAFLSLMAWHQWRQEIKGEAGKKGPPPLREEKAAGDAASEQ